MIKIIDYETAKVTKNELISSVIELKINGKYYYDTESIQRLRNLFKQLKLNSKCDTEYQEELFLLALEEIQYYQMEVL